MYILSENNFNSSKHNDTLIVYGCGSSINELNDDDKEHFSQFDSIAFNWFCKSNIKAKYYLIREQANIPSRSSKDETPEKLIKNLNNDVYKNSILIVHKLSEKSGDCLHYEDPKILNQFNHNGIIVNDLKLHNNAYGVDLWDNTNILSQGVYHGRATLNNVLHVAVYMKYKSIIFVGVDLYDSRYFWVKEGATRHSVKKKGRNYKDKYFLAKRIVDLVSETKKKYKINMSVYNKKSLLTSIMGVYKK